jgi:hypothetical protein
MAEQYFDRYGIYKVDGQVKPVPFIPLEEKPTDIVITTKETTRFDKLSQEYYANGKHGYLILQANPSYGGLEFDIPIGSSIRIPFPFRQSLQELTDKTNRHIELYGI